MQSPLSPSKDGAADPVQPQAAKESILARIRVVSEAGDAAGVQLQNFLEGASLADGGRIELCYLNCRRHRHSPILNCRSIIRREGTFW